MIPAGISTGEIEFFRDRTELFAMCSGIKVGILHLPADLTGIVDAAMETKHHECLDKMGIDCKVERRIQFLKCNCSSYDFTPDIVDGQLTLQREYVSCEFRGQCQYEGKFCGPIEIDGKKVTMAELRVTSKIRAEKSDKEICDELNIHPQTLRVQKASIQIKLNADRKVGIAMKAVQYGIS